jgi:hypothetical protein
MATQEYAQDPNGEMGMEDEEEGVIMAPMLVAKLQVRSAHNMVSCHDTDPLDPAGSRYLIIRHQEARRRWSAYGRSGCVYTEKDIMHHQGYQRGQGGQDFDRR